MISAPMSVEASNTPYADVVRQGQVTTSFAAPFHTLLFPLVADSPPSLEGTVVGVIELKRSSKTFDNEDIKVFYFSSLLSFSGLFSLLLAFNIPDPRRTLPTNHAKAAHCLPSGGGEEKIPCLEFLKISIFSLSLLFILKELC
jgi:hypothetical protein